MLEISIPGHEVLNLVGEGGMAQVWAGARLGAGNSLKPVAIKVIRPQYTSDDRYREMFLAEGRTTMMFSHGNIVTVFDVGADGDDLYIIMDWIDGVTLDEFARVLLSKRQRAMELSVVVTIITQLLCALDYAHNYKINRKKVGIVHRDVSPFNVMITSSGEIKLMDFGVARVAGGRTTRSFKGNLSFMSKEQAQGDPRVESDLYAVGGILFGLLEGKGFRSHCKTEDQLLQAIWEGAVPPLERPDLPEELRRLVRELLAPDWRDRPHSAAEVIKRLEELDVEQYTSLLPMQELYRTFFGESRSGLTRFAHRDPRMWVEHMRKQGQAATSGHRVVVRSPDLDEPTSEDRTHATGPRTTIRPRTHEPAQLHPAGEEARDDGELSFEQSKTVRYRPKDERFTAKVEDPSPQPRTDEDGEPPSVEPTVRLSWDCSADEQNEDRPVVSPTVRLPSAGSAADPANETASANGDHLRVPGLRGRGGWVLRVLSGDFMPAFEGWRRLATGPAGIFVLSCVVLGVMLPLACDLGRAQGVEVRR